jgi:CRISPR-associated protein Csh2
MSNEKLTTYPYRSEILFLYDVFRCNPNGDPFENRPRQDLLTGRIEVTDVRLKRTIRDYILAYKHEDGKKDGLELFVRVTGEGVKTAEKRFNGIFGEMPTLDKIADAKQKLVEQCVDVRLFGGLVPITKKEKGTAKDKEKPTPEEKGGGIQLTGAVQFNPGQSLHAAEIIEISGTGGFASKETAKQKTFRREYLVPYALIGFYGVINEHVAKDSGLTKKDVELLMEAIWNGTLFLHSRSKAFHHPRLLLRFDFKDEIQCGYFLDKLELKPNKDEKAIRHPKDYLLSISQILQEVEKRKGFLQHIYCQLDSGFSLEPENLEGELKKMLNNNGSELSFNQPFKKEEKKY